jgi:UDP-N-acetylglucosamine 2-epimerase (non-hydrolysing)
VKEKIITILGTRPEIIRLSRIIPKLDREFNNLIVHTGQNYDYELNKIFLEELKVRKPDYYLNAKGSFAEQISKIVFKLEKIIKKEKPSKFLVLGDTNSSLGAIVAKRMYLKVFHMEAGNRCYSNKSPEEVNRRIIDHSTDILLPYTKYSKRNLLKEGIKSKNIIITGNPITEVINFNKKLIDKSNIINRLNLKKKKYLLLTLHREENVDDFNKLKSFINAFNKIVKIFDLKIIWPVHPRTKKALKKNRFLIDKKIILLKPLGFIEFISLEKNCLATITDSGTVQEESAIFKIPCLVVREYTERPETVIAGSAEVLDCNVKKMINLINKAIKSKIKIKKIKDYSSTNVSSKILNIMKKK